MRQAAPGAESPLTTIVALYRGASLAAARLVAVSVDPQLTAEVAGRMLKERRGEGSDDHVLATAQRAETRALRLIKQQAEQEAAR